MSLFSFFSKSKKVDAAPILWSHTPSIYEHLSQHFNNDTQKIDSKEIVLPDEDRRFAEQEIRWVAGGMDGAFGYHWGGGANKKTAKIIANLVVKISKRNSISDKKKLYCQLLDDNLMDYIDPALEKIVNAKISINPHLHKLAIFLAKEAPDRGPVKFGISLLGLIGDPSDKNTILLLGRHEEFTLYSCVALTNIFENPENDLWDLAKSVDGWGRIQTVERLDNTTNSKLKDWLIREGYKNSIMHEYLAYTCATAGELRSAITSDHVDDELLLASGDLIQALITGGPAEDINDYEDAAIVVETYLKHIEKKTNTLSQYLTAKSIRDYLSDDNFKIEERRNNGWNVENKQEVMQVCKTILSRPEWTEQVKRALESNDDQIFYHADTVAKDLGIDTWDVHWQRLHHKPLDSGLWFWVMNNATPERVQKIANFAIEVLPLEKVATGAKDEMGFGQEFKIHHCLDFIVQGLDKHPGVGWPLIEASLKSPLIRNRNMALRALSGWGKESWPPEAIQALEKALAAEPTENVRDSISKVIAGKAIE